MSDLSKLSVSVNESLSELIQSVNRSLVVVHNGRRGAGAGVVWRAGGLIVTNQHVISGGNISVTLQDGRTVSVCVVARQPEFDLALLQCEVPDLYQAHIADSRDVKVGQMVFAIGHPLGQLGFVTGGIVSGLGSVKVSGPSGSVPVIRSDVLLAPGNSGGPLIDSMGGVIGINTMVVGGDLGVSIPSHIVDSFIQQAMSGDVSEAV